VDAIPDMAEKLVKEMGIINDPEKTDMTHLVCKKLYEKNVREQILPNMKAISTSHRAAYCSISAMILGMAPLKKITGE
jgi:hypothetical protein